jgi:hypothetical protein
VTQLAIDIPQVTVPVLKAQRTLAGDAVEADRIDGVASGDMPRLLVFWREEGEDVSGGSGPPAFAMELTLVVQALVERAARDDAVRDLDTIILQTQLALLEDPEWNRLAAIGSMRVSREFKGDEQLILGDGRIEFVMRWRESYQTRLGPVISGVNLQVDAGSPTDRLGDYRNLQFPAVPPPRSGGRDGRIEIAAKIDLPVS